MGVKFTPGSGKIEPQVAPQDKGGRPKPGMDSHPRSELGRQGLRIGDGIPGHSQVEVAARAPENEVPDRPPNEEDRHPSPLSEHSGGLDQVSLQAWQTPQNCFGRDRRSLSGEI